MKRFALLLTAAITVCMTHGASAQQKVAVPDGIFYPAQQPDQYLAKDLLLGAPVAGASGKIVGDVEDLILNEYNQVVGVIMGVGGFLGVGEKRVGVRYSALRFENKGGKTTVSLPTITREMLKSLPAYVRARPPKSFFEKVTERAKELSDKTSATTKDAYEKTKKDVGPALEQAQQKAGEVYEKAKEGVKDAYDKVKEKSAPQNQ
ncbi:MAG TPA: PRC-barrel domain-containing protein [Hyphomicrobiaceae bacterium]|nr:PRC-barrel domain-containing protein [Hyphomicrobiaceae bacterium]